MVKQWIAKFLVVNFLAVSFFVPMAQAGMIGTPSIIQQQQAQDNRARLNQILDRTDLQERLVQAGVDPADVKQRVNALSDQEVASLVEYYDQMPAGGTNILGLAVFIFLVLLFTDIMGWTDIFPFVKK